MNGYYYRRGAGRTSEGQAVDISQPLPMWTIYRNPSDFPGQIMARRWLVDAAGPKATSETLHSPDGSLGALRTQLASRGHVPLERHPMDDPCIVEVWV